MLSLVLSRFDENTLWGSSYPGKVRLTQWDFAVSTTVMLHQTCPLTVLCKVELCMCVNLMKFLYSVIYFLQSNQVENLFT